MRTDYRFVRPEMTEEESKAAESLGCFSIDTILETQDAPELVLQYCRRFKEAHDEWLAGAKDRPFTIRSEYVCEHVRLFDGPWFPIQQMSTSICASFPDSEDHRMWAVQPWDKYQKFAEAGDEQACRRLACVIYEYLHMREQADRLLVGTALILSGKEPEGLEHGFTLQRWFNDCIKVGGT